MTDFTIVNPEKNAFKTGTDINQKFVLGIQIVGNPSVGSGTLVTFAPATLIANGIYSAAGNKGTFTINVTPLNDNFAVAINITGSFENKSRSFTATASQSGQYSIQFTDVTGAGNQVVISRNNGSTFTDGKIDVAPNWVPITLYIDSNT